jgi:hypothetical protein
VVDRNFNSKKEMIGFAFNGVKQIVHLLGAKALVYIKKTHRCSVGKQSPSSNSKC